MLAPVRGLSLKWRLLIPLTLALAGGVISLTWINDANLRRQTEQTRSDNLATNAALLDFLTRQNIHQLIETGGGLADTLTNGGRLPGPSSDLGRLGQGQSLAGLTLFDAALQRVGGHGVTPMPQAALQRRLARVVERDAPDGGLYCAAECHFYALVPVLRDGQTIGALVLADDVSGLINGYARGTRREVGVQPDLARARVSFASSQGLRDSFATLALPPLAPPPPAPPPLAQPPLDAPRLTDSSPSFLPIASQFAIDDSDNRLFEWQRFVLPTTGGQAAALITRQDASAAHSARNNAFLVNLGTGLLVFLLAEAALLIALRWLMRRMARVSTGLPLLGRGQWLDARVLLRPAVANGSRDEFGDLERAALALADQLETLDLANHRQQHDLAQLVDTLSTERDFTQLVLDNAQALIVTQTTDGIVRMASRHAEILCGRRPGELVGRSFFGTLISATESAACKLRLAEHFQRDGVTPLHTEAPLDGADGVHNIAWVHTRLTESDGEILILSVGVDLTELKRAQAQASYLTEFDALTGLYNRQAFQTRLGQCLSTGSGTLVLTDLDNFKAINDLVGHEAGDEMIRQVATRLREISPAPQLAARLGGDDFALYFSTMEATQLDSIVAALCAGDRSHDIVSACVGIAHSEPGFHNAERLMAQADLALTKARAKGRGSWHLFSHSDGSRENLVARNAHYAQISDALREQRLLLYLQPVIALQTGRVSHYEALLRVRDDKGHLLAPGPLIAAAEESGLIRDIDNWVVQSSVELIAQSAGRIKLAVNLSTRSLDATLAPRIAHLLEKFAVSPGNISFEITETAALTQLDHATEQLAAIRALGCKLALDDFGVGFSTFQYLKQFPVDYVKIDGSFIRMLDRNEDDQLFVKALVDAIHGYGKLAVAEYVESDAILGWVQRLDVDFAQGYYFGRPRPAAEVLAAPMAIGK